MGFRDLFNERREQVRGIRPDLRIELGIGDSAEFPANRDYAYCAWDGEKARIVFAPKIRQADRSRQDALIRHELAHALLTSADLPHSERECDAVAEAIFGDLIYYDDDDVQTLVGGSRPRPPYLPNPSE